MSDKKPTDFRARWDDLRRECEALENDNSTKGLGPDDPRVLDQEAQIAANNTLRWEAAEAAWATRARDLADLLLLAEIAYDQFFDLRAFPSLPAEDQRQPPEDRGRLPDPRHCRRGAGAGAAVPGRGRLRRRACGRDGPAARRVACGRAGGDRRA